MATPLILLLSILLVNVAYAAPPAKVGKINGIRRQGNHIVDKDGNRIFLRGLNKAGTEYACIQGWGFFDGPSDYSIVQSFDAWKANAVRVPLNEDCWLGINGVNPEYSGGNYIGNITKYVEMFTDAGFVVFLDLHWTAAGGAQATGQQPMPDNDHANDLWKSVANQFKNNPNVVFELFNEPFPDNGNWNSQAGWQCFRDGGSCSGVNFQAAGMQSLVNAVRGTGATNLVVVGGLAWSNGLAQWLQYVPKDPLNNIGATWHSYSFNYCNNQGCWDQYVAPVAAAYPLFTTEFGENDCGGGYVTPLMQWMDGHVAGYLAWTFNTWDCSSGPALISSYSNNGVPTNYGQAVYNHYHSV